MPWWRRPATTCSLLDGRDQAVLDGKASGSATTRDAQLAVDRAEVGVDGAGTPAETVRHLAIGQPGCDQLQDVYLAQGQGNQVHLDDTPSSDPSRSYSAERC